MQIRRKEQKADQSLSPWEATVKNKGPEIALKWKRKLSRPGKKNRGHNFNPENNPGSNPGAPDTPLYYPVSSASLDRFFFL